MIFKFNFKKGVLASSDQIQSLIQNSTFDYISFDIFDTLLVRPCLNPTDILALIATKLDLELGIDFLSMRLPAESQMQNPNATIHDIYHHIQTTYRLSEEVTNRLMQEEIELETQCLQIRHDVKLFYDLAVQNNQKIIAISDMYLPHSVLWTILKNKGYDQIQQLFVSNEYKARKESGHLFDVVKSSLKTSNILHIGDHYQSDYIMPKKRGLTACYYPKITHFLSSNPILKKLIQTAGLSDTGSMSRNIIIGYTLNHYYNQSIKMKKSVVFNQFSDFVILFLAPYLYYLVTSLQKNPIIQTLYNRLHFVSRDGYLPYHVYQLLNNGAYIPGNYLYGSRLAYWTGVYTSMADVLLKQHQHVQNNYTLADFFNAYIHDQSVLNSILNTYSNQELNTMVRTQLAQCLTLLQRNQQSLEHYYNQQKKIAQSYYQTELNPDPNRVLVFDIGYSGSVSMGISRLSNKVVDKIYLSETSTNAFRDYRDATYTYVIKNGNSLSSFATLHLLIEECFSSLEGNCVGFTTQNNEVIPTFEATHFSESMIQDHHAMMTHITNYITQFSHLLGAYMPHLIVSDINPLFELTLTVLRTHPQTKSLFSNIIFPDKAIHKTPLPLSEKIPL